LPDFKHHFFKPFYILQLAKVYQIETEFIKRKIIYKMFLNHHQPE